MATQAVGSQCGDSRTGRVHGAAGDTANWSALAAVRRSKLTNTQRCAKLSCCTKLAKHEIMAAVASHSTVKVVGANGQISLGKQFAGRQVLVEEREPGVWMVRTATVIPDNERWLHEPQAAADLQTALAWAVAHPASDANTDDVLKRLGNGQH
jgi:hypothetical protein